MRDRSAGSEIACLAAAAYARSVVSVTAGSKASQDFISGRMIVAVRYFAVLLPLAALAPPAAAAPTPRGATVPVACSGPLVVSGRKIAKADGLVLGSSPGACFGRMQIYDGPNYQYVVVAPSASCKGGKAIDVYEKSRAGSWYAFFEKPVCGSKLSIGPKNPWGDWMLTIDGKHYDSRGAFYVPVNY